MFHYKHWLDKVDPPDSTLHYRHWLDGVDPPDSTLHNRHWLDGVDPPNYNLHYRHWLDGVDPPDSNLHYRHWLDKVDPPDSSLHYRHWLDGMDSLFIIDIDRMGVYPPDSTLHYRHWLDGVDPPDSTLHNRHWLDRLKPLHYRHLLDTHAPPCFNYKCLFNIIKIISTTVAKRGVYFQVHGYFKIFAWLVEQILYRLGKRPFKRWVLQCPPYCKVKPQAVDIVYQCTVISHEYLVTTTGSSIWYRYSSHSHISLCMHYHSVAYTGQVTFWSNFCRQRWLVENLVVMATLFSLCCHSDSQVSWGHPPSPQTLNCRYKLSAVHFPNFWMILMILSVFFQEVIEI